MGNPTSPEIVTLHSNPRRIALLATIPFLFATGCAFLLGQEYFQETKPDIAVTAILVIGLALFGSLVALGTYLLRHPKTLALDTSGISMSVLWTEKFIRWEEIANAHVYWCGFVRSVALDFTPEGALRQARGKYFAAMNIDLGTGWTSDHAYSPAELAALINSYRSAFRGAEEGSKRIG